MRTAIGRRTNSKRLIMSADVQLQTHAKHSEQIHANEDALQRPKVSSKSFHVDDTHLSTPAVRGEHTEGQGQRSSTQLRWLCTS